MARAKIDSKSEISGFTVTLRGTSLCFPMRNSTRFVLNNSKMAAGPGSRLLHLSVEPGPGERPVALGGRPRDAEEIGRLFQRAAGEEAEFDELCLLRVPLFEFLQSLVEGKEIDRVAIGILGQIRELDALQSAAAL